MKDAKPFSFTVCLLLLDKISYDAKIKLVSLQQLLEQIFIFSKESMEQIEQLYGFSESKSFYANEATSFINQFDHQRTKRLSISLNFFCRYRNRVILLYLWNDERVAPTEERFFSGARYVRDFADDRLASVRQYTRIGKPAER